MYNDNKQSMHVHLQQRVTKRIPSHFKQNHYIREILVQLIKYIHE